MAISNQRIIELLGRHTDRTASVEEVRELAEWFVQNADDGTFENYVLGIWESYEGLGETKVDWESLYNRILETRNETLPLNLGTAEAENAKISEMQGDENCDGIEETKVLKTFSIRRFLIAASVIAILGIGAYFIWMSNKPVTDSKPKEIVKSTDVKAPEINRATITLSDGSNVYLDSAGNGSLAQQGKIDIRKLSDGKIAYRDLPDVSQLTPDSSQLLYNTLTNPRGSSVVDITLSDGSRVWLNAESSIRYPVVFTGGERKVSITGEAYFEVAHDKKHPFHVTKGETSVAVLGTHFNINSYADDGNLKVTLLEGSVIVNSLASKSVVLLKPGEQAQVKGSLPISIDHSPDLEQVLAWKNGFFKMNNADIAAIMRQLARWYDINIEYDNGVPDGHISGKIPMNTNLSNALKVFEYSGVRFTIDGRKLIVHK